MVVDEREKTFEIVAELVRKFGFVSRSVVWKHLGRKARATKFRYWKYLGERRELSPYHVGVRSNEHLVASNEYRRKLGEGACAPVRSAVYFEHDEHLMNFLLALKHHGALLEYWTERGLKMNHLLALDILGGASETKLPDLVLSLKTDTTPLRVAIEIERTQKNHRRYQMVQLAYRRTRKVDLLLFGVADERTERAIRRAFDRDTPANLYVGYFSLSDFSKETLGAEFRIRQKTKSLEAFLAQVCGEHWKAKAGVASQRETNREIRVSRKMR